MAGTGGRSKLVAAVTIAATLILGGCNAKETGPDDAASTAAAPQVASPVPAVITDPAEVKKLSTFAGRDSDGDGKISEAEHSTANATIFAALDADKDGGLTVIELDAGRAALGLSPVPSSEKMISNADNDSDGKLTLAEWVAASNRDFDAGDADHDGFLTEAEWTARKDAREVANTPPPPPTK